LEGNFSASDVTECYVSYVIVIYNFYCTNFIAQGINQIMAHKNLKS